MSARESRLLSAAEWLRHARSVMVAIDRKISSLIELQKRARAKSPIEMQNAHASLVHAGMDTVFKLDSIELAVVVDLWDY